MDKLTTEQAECLIEQLKPILQNPNWGLNVCGYERVTQIINQCTEIKFPCFKMYQETDGSNIDVSKNMIDDENEPEDLSEHNIFITINYTGHAMKLHVMLDHNEFRDFTNSCNKIVEWLDSEEVKNG